MNIPVKRCLLATTLILTTLISYAGQEEIQKRLSKPYREISRSIDTTLSQEVAQFKLSFYENGIICRKEIQAGFNEQVFLYPENKKGKNSTQLKPGKYKLYFYVDGCDEVITDSISISPQEVIEAEINFEKHNVIIMVEKPVIYVYPEKEMEVNVTLDVNGKLGFTYPVYNDSWSFTANSDGKIKMEDKEYNYLFYDLEMTKDGLKRAYNTGFRVDSDTLLQFLENSLATMGLNSKESADFITYWYPRMQANEQNYIHFLFNEDCNVYAELNISPMPDNIFRIGMLWSPVEYGSAHIPHPQIIPTLSREGFTVIEWGGTEMKPYFYENRIKE